MSRWSKRTIHDYIEREGELFPEDYTWVVEHVALSALIDSTGETQTVADWREWYARERGHRHNRKYAQAQEAWYTPTVAEAFPIVTIYSRFSKDKLTVTGGHHRVGIALLKGWKTIPALVGRWAGKARSAKKLSRYGR